MAVSLSGLVLALAPTAASAATSRQTTNTSADLAALTAYRTYLSALTAGAQGAAARDTQVIDTVSGGCPSALSDLGKLSAGQLRKSALTAFGHEVDADLDLAYVSAGSAALEKFADALEDLTWSTTAQFNITMQLITGEQAVLDTAQSSLCKDAVALDAAPLSEPSATKRFLVGYSAATSTLDADLSAFQALLAKFETTSERKLVGQVNALVGQYTSQSGSVQQADASALLLELGVTG